MAMRRFSAREFERELERRGCEKVGDLPSGSYWREPKKGRVFQVPPPDDPDDGYPDYILDDLIKQHDLPSVPIKGD